MIRIVPIVEGVGDVEAVPQLVGKAASYTGKDITCSRPIKAGEWKKLKKRDLSRYLELAHRRADDGILLILDLDDGCPVEESQAANQMIENWKNGREIDVSVVFLNREYETMFLYCATDIDPSFTGSFPNADEIRGAKERVREIIGRRYKEPQDQPVLTKSLNAQNLHQRSRAFRKLCSEMATF